MDEQTLEPCPFCGSDEPTIEKVSALSRLSAVFCNACEISGEKMSTPEAAVAAWNRRAAHSVIAGKVAELEALTWFGTDTRLSLDHYSPVYCDDGDQSVEWRVRRQSGSINDREWDVVGRGETPLAAIVEARAALAPYPERRHD